MMQFLFQLDLWFDELNPNIEISLQPGLHGLAVQNGDSKSVAESPLIRTVPTRLGSALTTKLM